MEWSKEYCGLSHLGKFDSREVWVTVERFHDCAKLLQWFPGCRFTPKETWHKSVAEAKRAGEILVGIDIVESKMSKKRVKVKF